MKYKNRVEEGAYQNTSIQDEIVVKYFVVKRRQKHMKLRINLEFHFNCISILFSIGKYEFVNWFIIDGRIP